MSLASTRLGGPDAPGAGVPTPADPSRRTVVRTGGAATGAAIGETMLRTLPGDGSPPPGDPAGLRSTIDAAIFTTPGKPGKIDRFTVLRVLGEGGMGVVYAAYDEELDRRVAIKLVRDELHEGTQGRSRILREAQAMARVSHPNVVQVYEVGEFAGQVFVAMEFVKGIPLSDWTAADEHTWQDLRDMFVQAGKGLAAAHAEGLVHRDFKPDNVLVGSDGRARVLDFGLARAEGAQVAAADPALAGDVAAKSAFSTKLTVAGSIMGTPAYMSPEQHMGAETGAASDQFSFCVALYEALSGQHPFTDAETYTELVAAVLDGEVRPPPAGVAAPPWLFAVLRVGMAMEPAERHPSMDTLLAALGQDTHPELARPRWLWPGLTAALVVAAVFLTLAMVRDPAATSEELATIERLEREAREAATRSRWVYPERGAPEDTAYRRIAALEALEGGAAAPASERARDLRLAFAADLIALGDRYFEDPMTRPLARDAYVQALVFAPENPTAGERAGLTLGQLADLRQRAEAAEFSAAETLTGEALRLLAKAAPGEGVEGLLALREREEWAESSAWLALSPLLIHHGGALAAANEDEDVGDGGGDPGEDPEAVEDVAGEGSASSETPPKGRRPGNGGRSPKASNRGDPSEETDSAAKDREDPAASKELTTQAEAARRRGALGEAEQLYHQALALWSRNGAALIGLSDLHFDRGAFDRAVKFAKDAVKAEPSSGAYRLRLGDAYFKLLRYNEAREAYEAAKSRGEAKAAERLDRVKARTGE